MSRETLHRAVGVIILLELLMFLFKLTLAKPTLPLWSGKSNFFLGLFPPKQKPCRIYNHDLLYNLLVKVVIQ